MPESSSEETLSARRGRSAAGSTVSIMLEAPGTARICGKNSANADDMLHDDPTVGLGKSFPSCTRRSAAAS